MKNRVQQKGFTLVEVMISLILASLIILAVVSLFIGNSRNYRMEEGNARIQENGRFALDMLTENIRGAGYSGCLDADKIRINVIATAPVPEAFTGSNNIIQGFEAGAGLPVPVAGTTLAGTDAITLRRADGCGASLTGNLAAANANIQIQTPNTCNLQQNDIVMVSDCEDAHIFRVTNNPGGVVVHAASGNDATHLCRGYPGGIGPGACAAGENKLYRTDSEIMKMSAVTYYIRNNGANPPIPSLYEYTRVGGALELVEGVDDMQILYGLDTVGGDKIIDVYANANAVADWSQVVGVKLNLLLASIDDNVLDGLVPGAPFTATADGLTVNAPAADLQLRRVFSSAIGLRNSVP